jgi:hypothetical protein
MNLIGQFTSAVPAMGTGLTCVAPLEGRTV